MGLESTLMLRRQLWIAFRKRGLSGLSPIADCSRTRLLVMLARYLLSI